MPYDRGYSNEDPRYRTWNKNPMSENAGPWTNDGTENIEIDEDGENYKGRFVRPQHIGTAQDEFAPNEVGLTHPNRNSFLRIRDNGDIEIIATDGCSIILSGIGRTISLNADEVRFSTNVGGFQWNNAQFNDNALSFTEPALVPRDIKKTNTFLLASTKTDFAQKDTSPVSEREQVTAEHGDYLSAPAVAPLSSLLFPQRYGALPNQKLEVQSNTGISSVTAQQLFPIRVRQDPLPNYAYAGTPKLSVPASFPIRFPQLYINLTPGAAEVPIVAANVAPPTVYRGVNDRISVTVSGYGSSGLGYYTMNGNQISLIYGWGGDGTTGPTTSFATVYVDGATTKQTGVGPTIAPHWVTSTRNESAFRNSTGVVQVDQVIEKTRWEVFYTWTVTNISSANHTVGFRSMFDAMVRGYDQTYYLIDGQLINVGTIFTPSLNQLFFTTPNYIQELTNYDYYAWDNPHGYVNIGKFTDARTPSSLIIYSWSSLNGAIPWYPSTYGNGNGDSAWAVFWDPIVLSPGQSFVCKKSISIDESG